MKQIISACSPLEIAGLLEIKPFQGRQIFRWIHQKRIFDFHCMTDLPLPLRQRLCEEFTATQILPIDTRLSQSTGTKKVLFQLMDGETIESVLIRDQERITLCLSSQAGCALKCAFCATGQAGFRRHLEVHEIIEQALHLLREEDLEGRTPNIVYMGMGEPLRNYDAVMRSIRLLMEKDGLAIGARKITVSTAGEVPQIERFADEDWQVRLSISLHAANNPLRSKLVPINRKYPLERLRNALDLYCSKTNRQITFEWTLLDGVNDSPEHAAELLEYAQGLKAFVNIIPWNPVKGLPFKPAPIKRCEEFRNALIAGGLQATLRQEKGQDIEAACGQLRRIHISR
ncbi:MAG TPA: 23S rRNA (adenine(2503)-C(2))-methyltransferase RlmN [Candidatus Hydrogenedentes bacterium]|nr:23S rRNA (adenine(2503)-C(2))-methyltransferase RlmN [Candidatus Hydrogenedentota bacterium]